MSSFVRRALIVLMVADPSAPLSAQNSASTGGPRTDVHMSVRRVAPDDTRHQNPSNRLVLHGKTPVGASAIPASWGSLHPGPHRVGFTAWVARDSARRGPEGARPVQVSVWFPVTDTPRRIPMRYEDYVGLASSESGGGDTEGDRENAVAAFSGFLARNGVPDSTLRPWLASEMLASRDDGIPRVTLPIVLVAQGNGQTAYSQAVLAEYLASRGFVVVTTPSPVRTGATLQTERDVYGVALLQAADLRFAARAVAAKGSGSLGRLAVIGHSFGARAGLLLLSSGFTSELISLDGGIGMDAGKSWLDGIPFDPSKVRGRIMHLYETTDSLLRPDFALLQSMTGASRELIVVPGIAHWQFTSFGTITPRFPGVAPGSPAPRSAERAADVVRYATCRLEEWTRPALAATGCRAMKGALEHTARWPAALGSDSGTHRARRSPVPRRPARLHSPTQTI